MELQEFIQNMPDELLSDKGKEFKKNVNDWFDLQPLFDVPTESSAQDVNFIKDKQHEEMPIWHKQ